MFLSSRLSNFVRQCHNNNNHNNNNFVSIFSKCLHSYEIPKTCKAFQLVTYNKIEHAQYNNENESLQTNLCVINEIPVSPPQSNEILVKIRSVALNQIDLHQYYSGYAHSLVKLNVSLPITLGKEASGEIIRIGSGIWNYRSGQSVWISKNPVTSGCFTEYCTVYHNELSIKPKSIDFNEAAAIPFGFTTVWSALTQANVSPVNTSANDSEKQALVHGGAGPVGLIAIQLLKAWGYVVTATCRSIDEMERISAFLPTERIIDTSRHPITDFSSTSASVSYWVDKLEPEGFVLFFDCVGNGEAEQAGLAILQPGKGKFITLCNDLISSLDQYGLLEGATTAATNYLSKKARFAGKGLLYYWGFNQPSSEALKLAKSLVDRGELRAVVDPHSLNKFQSIESIPDALHYLKTQKPKGKVVVKISD